MKKLILIILAVLMLSGCVIEVSALATMSSDEKFNRDFEVFESQKYQVRCFMYAKRYASMSCVSITPQQ